MRFSSPSPRCLWDCEHLLVRLQHHPGLLRPLVPRNQVSVGAPLTGVVGGPLPHPELAPPSHRPCPQVRAGPRPLPGLERLPARHPGWHLPHLQLLRLSEPGPRRQVREGVPRGAGRGARATSPSDPGSLPCQHPASVQGPGNARQKPRCPPAHLGLG